VRRSAVSCTRRGWTIVGAAAGLLVGGRVLGADELSVLGLAGLALVVLSLVWVVVARPRLDVERRVDPSRLHVGDVARADLVCSPRGGRASALLDLVETIDGGALRARFLLAPIEPGHEASPAYRVPTERRGSLALGPARAAVTDPLGLARRGHVVAESDEVLVRPRVHTIVPPLLGAGRRLAHDDDRSPRAAATDATGEFLAVRPYETGDDPRRVHWRSSARTDELMVRQFEAPRRGATLVVLDTRTRARPIPTAEGGAGTLIDVAFERAVEGAASIVTCLQRSRRPVECSTTAGVMLTRGSTDTSPTVLDRLATVAPGDRDELVAMLAGLRRRPPELVVFVTANLDAEAIDALRACRPRSAVLVVCTGGDAATADLRIVDARVDSFPDAWRAANARTRATAASRATNNPSWTSAAPSLRPVRSPR
jgi:uncharacterized protein (DUF58 family)